jgi:hypothetical protein
MPIEIQPASFDLHKAEMIALLGRHLTPDSDETRFHWLYRANPSGRAQAWLAWDTTRKSFVGLASAFPRRFYLHGKEKLGLVLGDFCLAEEYRSMGPALQLQRACLKALVAPFDFCYDFPSKSMMAIYKRMGIQQAGLLVRWAKPLRINEKLEAIVGSRGAGTVIAPIVNKFLAVRGWKGEKSSCHVDFAPPPYGDEFSALNERLRRDLAVSADRGAPYLNWRYFEGDRKDYEVLAARRNGALVGYIALKNNSKDARIVELVSLEEPGVIVRLIAQAVHRLRLGGARSVSLVAGENHRWGSLFERAGFKRRETCPVVFAVRDDRESEEAAFYSGSYFMEGERDS